MSDVKPWCEFRDASCNCEEGVCKLAEQSETIANTLMLLNYGLNHEEVAETLQDEEARR